MAKSLHRLDYSAANCSLTGALALLGEKWTLQVVREAFLGLRRFEEFRQAIGCARNLLTLRLQRLVEAGVLVPLPYREAGQRERLEYRLTDKGRELAPILIALLQWGDRWVGAPERPPLIVRHLGCDAPVRAEIRCTHGHGPLTARETYATPGPGALRARPRRTARKASSRA
ncbi:MAG: helix-turn-helix transcriptional regulator [Verrucomicrobia bacterium]|nr:helix-turn-helix transcriptional regulator [Verrucomicrobiota bacterium]